MSVVTEVILVCYPTTPADVQKIVGHPFVSVKPSQPDRSPQFLNRLDSGRAGGTKYASWDTFQAAFNYVGTDVILDWFDNDPVLKDLSCILTISDEQSDDARVWTRNVEYMG